MVFEDGPESVLAESSCGGRDLGESLICWREDGDTGETIDGGSKASLFESSDKAGQTGGSGSLGSRLSSRWGLFWVITIVVWAVSVGRSLN